MDLGLILYLIKPLSYNYVIKNIFENKWTPKKDI